MVEPSVGRRVGRSVYEDMKKRKGLDCVTKSKNPQDSAISKDRKFDSRYRKCRTVNSLPDVTRAPVTESNVQYDGRDNVTNSKYHSLEQLAQLRGNAVEFYDADNLDCYDVHTPYERTMVFYDEEDGVCDSLRRLEQEEKILNKMAANVINGRNSPTDSEERLFKRNYEKLCETLEGKENEQLIGKGRKMCCYPCRPKPTRSNSKVEERKKYDRQGNNSSPRTKNTRNASQPRKVTSEEEEFTEDDRRRNSGTSSGIGQKRPEIGRYPVNNNGPGSSFERRRSSGFSNGRIDLEFPNDDYSDISRGGNRSYRGNSTPRRLFDEGGNASDGILREVQPSGEYEDTLENVESGSERNRNERTPERTYTKGIDVDIGGNDYQNERIEVIKNSDKSPPNVNVIINIDKDRCRSDHSEEKVLQKWREEILRLCRDNTIRSRDKSDSSYYSPPDTLSHLNMNDLVEECKKCIRKCPKEGKRNLKKYIEKLLRMTNDSVDELEESGAKTASDAFIEDLMDKAGQIDNLDYNKDQAVRRPSQDIYGRQTRRRGHSDDMPSPLEDRFPNQSRIPPSTEDNFNQTYPRTSRIPFDQSTDRKNLSYQSETFDEPNYSKIIEEYCDPIHDMPLAPTAITHGELDEVEPSPLKNNYRLPSDSTLKMLEDIRDGEIYDDSFEDEDESIEQREEYARSQGRYSDGKSIGRSRGYKSYEIPKSERGPHDVCERRITEGGKPMEKNLLRSRVRQDLRGNPSISERRYRMQKRVEVVESDSDEKEDRVTEITEVEEVEKRSILEGFDPDYSLPDFDYFVEKGYFNKDWEANGKEIEHDPDDFLKPPTPSVAEKTFTRVKGIDTGNVNLLGKKIGLPWVESTLKRTQQASALGSTSNDDSFDEARNRGTKWRSQSGSNDLVWRGIDNRTFTPRPNLTRDFGSLSINEEPDNKPIEGAKDGKYFYESTPKKGRRANKNMRQFDAELSEVHPERNNRFPRVPDNVSRTIPSYATIPEDNFSIPSPAECRKFRQNLSFEDED